MYSRASSDYFCVNRVFTANYRIYALRKTRKYSVKRRPFMSKGGWIVKFNDVEVERCYAVSFDYGSVNDITYFI